MKALTREDKVNIMASALIAQCDYITDGYDNEMVLGSSEDIIGEYGEEITNFWFDCLNKAQEAITTECEAELVDEDKLAEEMIDENGDFATQVTTMELHRLHNNMVNNRRFNQTATR